MPIGWVLHSTPGREAPEDHVVFIKSSHWLQAVPTVGVPLRETARGHGDATSRRGRHPVGVNRWRVGRDGATGGGLSRSHRVIGAAVALLDTTGLLPPSLRLGGADPGRPGP